jgi:hypothetical protein
MKVPQKTKNRTTIPSSDNTPGHITKGIKPEYNSATCTPMFIAALFTTSKPWKQPRYPTSDEGLRKAGIYTQWSIHP